jgi:mannan endo-1,4-beta-mannosidase
MAIKTPVSAVPAGDMPSSVATTPGEGAPDTFSTEGRQLLDSAGNKVILRGVNKMSVWDSEDPKGEISFAEIRKTRANSVRIVWLHTLNGAPTDTATLDALITNARANHLIPMIELHDATGDWSGLQGLVDYWTQPAVLNIIQKHQAYLLLNIGNEVGDDQVDAQQFQLGYTSAVQTLRGSGVLVPLVIDAATWGQNLEVLDATAAALIEADARKNLVFSVHAYWSKSCGASPVVIRSRFETSVALQYPLIVGEFSKYGGFPCNDPTASMCSAGGEIDYQTILQVCHEHEIGWYAWEWGPGNGFNDPLCAVMDMTSDRLFGNLQPGWAEEVAISSPFSIANTSLTPSVLLDGDGIPDSANEITIVPSGTRSDPEGVAAPAAVNVVTWKDARGGDRSMVLGPYLYQYDLSFSDNTGIVTCSANDDAFGHPGFGYVVSHNTQTGNSPLGKANVPTTVATTILSGGHHAFHRIELVYDRDKEGGGLGISIPVIIEWLVATGRDHPVWAVTWKVGSAIAPEGVNFDQYRMDVRGPYGSLNFDGAPDRNAGDAVGGVAWGDFGLSFTTTDAQLTLNSPWTYNTPNDVNFCRAWTANTNAEMGIVQTRVGDKEMPYQDRVVGRERGAVSTDPFLEHGNCTELGDDRQYVMPCIGGWPYQLMNFDWDPSGGKPLDEATGTKLIAWGSPYGWLGASSFDLFDFSGVADGRGDRAYSTFIVIGPKQRFNADSGKWDQPGDVVLAIRDVEALAAATIGEVGPGSVVSLVPQGPGAEQTKSIVNGYNDTYAVYCLQSSGNLLSFVYTPAAGLPVRNPIFNVQNYTTGTLPALLVNDIPITINSGDNNSQAFVSVNAATNELWVTLNATIETAVNIDVR